MSRVAGGDPHQRQRRQVYGNRDAPLEGNLRLEIAGISPSGAAVERRLVFDPTNLADGIALSADPILLARSAAYSISYERRSKGE